MGSPTIKDVARKAGVSVATVSYVINNGPRPVTEETQQLVRVAMEELGYAPNASARRLRRQHNHVIGIALAGLSGKPGISDLYFLDILRGISFALDQYNYDMMVFSNRQKLSRSDFYRSLAAQHMIDGLVAMGSTINPEGITLMNNAGTPAYLVGRQRYGARVRRVTYTFREDLIWATRYLLNKGHRRISLLLNPLALHGESERLSGYQYALEQSGVPFDPSLVYISPEVFQFPSKEAVQAMLATAAPTAFITAPYAEVCHFLDELNVPREVVVVTVDEESHIPHLPRVVAAAHLAKYEAGMTAIDLVMKCLQGEQHVPEEVILPSRYVEYE